MIVFETSRLAVRAWQEGDIAALEELLGDPQTMAHWPAPLNTDDVRNWFERAKQGMAEHGCARWCCMLKQDNTIVGDVGIMRAQMRGRRVYDLGYIVSAQHWRQGYGFEAAQGAVSWARTQSFKVLAANMAIDNHASVATIEKLGFDRVDTFVNERNRDKLTYWYELKL